jgi:hypothetical protein
LIALALSSAAALHRNPARMLKQRHQPIDRALGYMAGGRDPGEARITAAGPDAKMLPDGQGDTRGDMRQIGCEDGAEPLIAL